MASATSRHAPSQCPREAAGLGQERHPSERGRSGSGGTAAARRRAGGGGAGRAAGGRGGPAADRRSLGHLTSPRPRSTCGQRIDPEGQSATYRFEYETEAAYAANPAPRPIAFHGASWAPASGAGPAGFGLQRGRRPPSTSPVAFPLDPLPLPRRGPELRRGGRRGGALLCHPGRHQLIEAARFPGL